MNQRMQNTESYYEWSGQNKREERDIELKRKEQEYLNLLSSRYGADIATLIKLRFDEIHRVVVDELEKDDAQNTKPASTQKLLSLFLGKVKWVLKKDSDLNNMFAEDKELRLWAAILFLDKNNGLV